MKFTQISKVTKRSFTFCDVIRGVEKLFHFFLSFRWHLPQSLYNVRQTFFLLGPLLLSCMACLMLMCAFMFPIWKTWLPVKKELLLSANEENWRQMLQNIIFFTSLNCNNVNVFFFSFFPESSSSLFVFLHIGCGRLLWCLLFVCFFFFFSWSPLSSSLQQSFAKQKETPQPSVKINIFYEW